MSLHTRPNPLSVEILTPVAISPIKMNWGIQGQRGNCVGMGPWMLQEAVLYKVLPGLGLEIRKFITNF